MPRVACPRCVWLRRLPYRLAAYRLAALPLALGRVTSTVDSGSLQLFQERRDAADHFGIFRGLLEPSDVARSSANCPPQHVQRGPASPRSGPRNHAPVGYRLRGQPRESAPSRARVRAPAVVPDDPHAHAGTGRAADPRRATCRRPGPRTIGILRHLARPALGDPSGRPARLARQRRRDVLTGAEDRGVGSRGGCRAVPRALRDGR